MKWIIAEEYNSDALEKLKSILNTFDFDCSNAFSGVAGSQEVSHWELHSKIGSIVVELETYIGLSIEGDVKVIEKIKNEYFK